MGGPLSYGLPTLTWIHHRNQPEPPDATNPRTILLGDSHSHADQPLINPQPYSFHIAHMPQQSLPAYGRYAVTYRAVERGLSILRRFQALSMPSTGKRLRCPMPPNLYNLKGKTIVPGVDMLCC